MSLANTTSLIPPSSGNVRRQELCDQLCRRFQREWRDGRQPRIETFLAELERDDRTEVLRELFATEVELKLGAGGEVPITEYLARFPDDATVLESVYAEVVNEAAESQTRADSELPERIGDYRIERELGRGGMGIVYLAVQESLGRQVALKVLPPSLDHDAIRRRRFEVEARAIARLHHHHIVEVYGIGQHEGTSYFAMQFIDGEGLDKRIQVADAEVTSMTVPRPLGSGHEQSRTRPLPNGRGTVESVRHAARIGQQIADALHYAHTNGILHRDVKPSNVLIDKNGDAWLTDFGLAKLSGIEVTLTAQGDVLGTFRYMPPEAFRSQSDARSDVYSLGVTLYELLARIPAFSDKSREGLMYQIMETSPARLDKLRPKLPRDLVTIIHKSIERDPAARYQTAGDFADDLRRFQADEPIRARPISPLERFQRWSRRNRALAASLVTTATLLVVSLIASLIAASHFKTLVGEKSRLAKSEETAKTKAENSLKEAQAANRQARLTLADLFTSRGLTEAENGHDRDALLWFVEAIAQSEDDPARQRANRVRFRSWSRRVSRPIGIVETPYNSSVNFVLHGDGRQVLIDPLFQPQGTMIFDVLDGQRVPWPNDFGDVQVAAWSQDRRRLAVGSQQRVLLADSETLVVLQTIEFAEPVKQLAFDSPGKLLAIGGEREVRVWDRELRRFVGETLPHPAGVQSLEFHPTEPMLLTTSPNKTFRVFKFLESNQPFRLDGQYQADDTDWSRVQPIFSHDGSRLIAPRDRSQLVVHATVTDAAATRLVPSVTDLTSLVTSSRTPFVCVGGSGGGCVMNLQSGYRWALVDFQVLGTAFDDDRQVLAVAGASPNVELFSTQTWQRIGTIAVHPEGCLGVAFSPDGSRLATMGYDKHTRLWDVPTIVAVGWDSVPTGLQTESNAGSGQSPNLPPDFSVLASPNPPTHEHVDHFVGGSFSADSKWLLKYEESGLLRVFNVETRQPKGAVIDTGNTLFARFSPDQRMIAAASERRNGHPEFSLWDWRTGDELFALPLELPPLRSSVPCIEFSTDSRRVAIIGRDGHAAVIDTVEKKVLASWELSDRFIVRSLSPDGQWMVVVDKLAQPEGTFLCRIDTGEKRRILPRPRRDSYQARFSHDSRVVACCDSDTVHFVDTTSGQTRFPPLRHPTWVYAAEFSNDGKLLLTFGKDSTARVWEIATGKLLGAQPGGDDIIAAFRPGQREVLMTDYRGRFHVWDWQQTQRLMPVRHLPVIPDWCYSHHRTLEVSPDGRFVAIGGNPSLHVLNLDDLDAPDELPLSELRREAEVLSHHRVLDNGAAVNLTLPEWLRRWNSKR